jgi:bacteriophage N4 adsorption protein B
MMSALYWIEQIQHEMLIFSAFWFMVGAADDVCIDGIWIVRHIYRRAVFYRTTKPMRVEHLPAPAQSGTLAVFIATWQEAAVIGAMLGACHARWIEHSNHLIYVGCYPNDAAGIEVVRRMSLKNTRIRMVICKHPGPTTKADCLNNLWRAMLQEERATATRFKAVVLHDAEDLVHADELRIYDRLIETKAAVQLPVIPIRVKGSRWISGHYCDEFAEAHSKTLLVREAIGAPLPLAGVGCAIHRDILERIAGPSKRGPFDVSSLTEDYEIGLKIGALGHQTILVRMLDSSGNMVGTRACFPATLNTSARQKSRWLLGISLNGWDRLGWSGNIAQKWMLLRDRKALFAAIVLIAAYLCIILTGIMTLAIYGFDYPYTPISPGLRTMLIINAALFVWRILIRALAVWHQYGWIEAMYSAPRIVVANVIAIVAARRALTAYVRHCFGAALLWDKTDHAHFPENG